MGIKKRVFDFFAGILIKPFLNKAGILSCSLAEVFQPVYTVRTDNIRYIFSCPNNVIKWRLDTYFTKEPETIEWIDTFKDGDILFDIGANIGLYSIYAAKKGFGVIAFEPESQNYAQLNKNVYLNQCQDKITCFNIALSDKNCLDYLNLPSFSSGEAESCLSDCRDEQDKYSKSAFRQGVVVYSLDSFLSQCQYFPNHIKIDVDGIEPEIIKGSEKTLKDARLKSLLVEIDERSQAHLELVKIMRSNGFSLRHKKHAGMFDNGVYSKFFNYVFVRTPSESQKEIPGQ